MLHPTDLARRTSDELQDAEVFFHVPFATLCDSTCLVTERGRLRDPLRVRAGVPEVGGACNTADVLAPHNPPLAAICEEPSLFVLDEGALGFSSATAAVLFHRQYLSTAGGASRRVRSSGMEI